MKKRVSLLTALALFFVAFSAPVQLTGVFLDLSSQQKPSLSLLAKSGFNSIRILIPWKTVEPTRNHFDFTEADEIIKEAHEENLELLVTLGFPPAWAAGDAEDSDDVRSKLMPNDLKAWTRYISATVKRYHKWVHRWQIWEKPSIENFEGTSNDYLTLLHSAYPTIKKINPEATVFASDPGGPDLGFIQNLFSQKNIGSFDGIALAPELDSPFQFSEYWKMLKEKILKKTVYITDWKLPPQNTNRNVSDDYLEGAYTTALSLGVEGFFAPAPFPVSERKEGIGPEPNSISGPACVEFSADGDKEDGLLTKKYRNQLKANPANVQVDSVTAAEFVPNDNAFLYVDVDDRFIFFNPDRNKIKITVHANATDPSKKAGMNLMYDSPRGYVFSPWITITPGADWKDYQWILSDANFANKGGFDFRLSDLGSDQTIYVSKLCVEK